VDELLAKLEEGLAEAAKKLLGSVE
jgi:hypothetical protein